MGRATCAAVGSCRALARLLGVVALAVSAGTLAVTGPAQAQASKQTPTEVSGQAAFGPGWQCHPARDLDQVVVEDDRFTLNGFKLDAATSSSLSAPVATLALTAEIRTARKLALTVQAAALDAQGRILFATALSATGYEMPSEATTRLDTLLNVRAGELEATSRVCLKVDIRLER